MKSKTAFLVAVAILWNSGARANPPEYLAASRQPAESAGEQPSPFDEPSLQLPEWRLALSSNEPFFRDSVFSLEPRFYYRYLDDNGLHEAVATGGALLLTSGWWHDFLQLGVGGYTSQPLATPHDAGGTGLLGKDGGGLSVLGQAWAKLSLGPATATLFRQKIDIPFINSDDSRMIPNTFEAYRVDVDPSDIFRFGLAYIMREKSKTSAEFRPMSEVAGGPGGVDRGTSVAGFFLGRKEETYIGAVNELTWDVVNIAYVEASRVWQFSDDFQLRGLIQFVDQQSVGDDLIGRFATQLYGASLIASYRSAVLSLAFTSTAGGANVLKPFGGTPAFNSLMISDFDRSGENSVGVGVSYDFARIGLAGVTFFADYAHGEFPNSVREDEINATLDYRIGKGSFNNIWFRLRYGHNWETNQPEKQDFRIIINYVFAF